MSLEDLDRLLALRGTDLALSERMGRPLSVQDLIALAAERGLSVTETDVLAAQEREEARCAPEELQERAAQEARRLRHFIQG